MRVRQLVKTAIKWAPIIYPIVRQITADKKKKEQVQPKK